MCSILEGHVRGGLQESPVKHLNGNQIKPAVLTRMGYAHKVINGMPGFMSGCYGLLFTDYSYDSPPSQTLVPPPATPYESCVRRWTLYSTLVQVYNQTDKVWIFTTGGSDTAYTIAGTYSTVPNPDNGRYGVDGYTGGSGLVGNCPANATVPTALNPASGNSHHWGFQDPGTNCGCVTAATISDTFWEKVRYDIYGGGAALPFYSAPMRSAQAKLQNTLSGPVDCAAFYSSVYTDFFNKSFSSTWATAFGDIYYKDIHARWDMDLTSVSPATYDGSIQSSGPDLIGSGAGNLSGIYARNGWMITANGADSTAGYIPGINPGGGAIMLFRGQSKLDISVSVPENLPFWIGLAKIVAPNQMWWDANGNYENFTNNYFGNHGSWPTLSLSIIRQGTMNPGDVIAYESTGVFNLPFPTVPPFPIQSYADAPVIGMYYFVVIGQDPAGWAKQYGYHFDVLANNSYVSADNTQTI